MKVFVRCIILIGLLQGQLWAKQGHFFFEHYIGVQFESLDYASPQNNENAQSLPIPIRINEVIYPTLGFPSLVQAAGSFPIVLQLNPKQQEILKSTRLYDLKFEIRLSPDIGFSTDRKVPKGFRHQFKNYQSFIDHTPDGTTRTPAYFSLKPGNEKKMSFVIKTKLKSFELFENKLILKATLPQDIPEHQHRALDLEVKISKGNQVILHDVQYHSVGLLKEKQKFTFIHMADPQINNIDFSLNGHEFKKQPDLSTQASALLQASKEMNFIQPDFAIISGDLTEGGNENYTVRPPLSGLTKFFAANRMLFTKDTDIIDYKLEKSSYWNEYGSILRFIRMLKFPVFSATGNHDGFSAYEKLNNSQTVKKIKFSDTVIGAEAQKVLYDGKHFWRKILGPRYYSFDVGMWHFVALDTYDLRRYYRQAYCDLAANHGGWISKKQMSWLKTDLRAATKAGKNIVLFGHHDPRGGSGGMFYDKAIYRRTRRVIKPLHKEIGYQFDHYSQDKLFAAQEWVAPQDNLDHGYDSAKEFLNLMGTYNVTHYLLGHVHSDYSDIVKVGDRKVHFIHTTALSAQAYDSRSRKEHVFKEGQGKGYDAHWGYRIFQFDQSGNLDELFTPQNSKTDTHPDHPSLELGKIRINVGYNDNFRRKIAGIWSPDRPRPSWLPYSDFMTRLEKNNLLPWIFRHNDPLLTFRAILDPKIAFFATQLYTKKLWSPKHKKDFEDRIGKLYVPMTKEIGEAPSPNQIFMANLHDFDMPGTLEFYSQKNIPETADLRVLAKAPEPRSADLFDLKFIALEELSKQTISTTTHVIQNQKWNEFSTTLPAKSNDSLRYIEVDLINK